VIRVARSELAILAVSEAKPTFTVFPVANREIPTKNSETIEPVGAITTQD
jgi:hypothetical protein